MLLRGFLLPLLVFPCNSLLRSLRLLRLVLPSLHLLKIFLPKTLSLTSGSVCVCEREKRRSTTVASAERGLNAERMSSLIALGFRAEMESSSGLVAVLEILSGS